MTFIVLAIALICSCATLGTALRKDATKFSIVAYGTFSVLFLLIAVVESRCFM